jgi:addiction module RelE/StbE family toxin
MTFIAQDNPLAALELDDEIEEKTAALIKHPRLYKPGRMKGTREMVVRPNYVVVYQDGKQAVTILRVLHTAQQWP